MTWENVPTRITEWRDRLLECATVQTILTGIATGAAQQSHFHFPEADPTENPMPYAVLETGAYTTVLASAGRSMGSGEVVAVFHFDDESVTVGTVEGYGISLAHELPELTTEGLYIIGVEAQRCSEPTTAQKAAAEPGQTVTSKAFCTLTVTARWEG